MSGIALLASRLKSGKSSATPRQTDSFITYTSRTDVDEADYLDDVFANHRPLLVPHVTVTPKKEPRELKSLDIGKIASFAEKSRARRMLNDILEQWASFSALSKTTRESSVLALQKTMSSARARLLSSSLLTLQVFTARLSGSTELRMGCRPENMSVQKTHLVSVPSKLVHLSTLRASEIEIDGTAHLNLTCGVQKATTELLRLERMLNY